MVKCFDRERVRGPVKYELNMEIEMRLNRFEPLLEDRFLRLLRASRRYGASQRLVWDEGAWGLPFTSISDRLLEHWQHMLMQQHHVYYCQLMRAGNTPQQGSREQQPRTWVQRGRQGQVCRATPNCARFCALRQHQPQCSGLEKCLHRDCFHARMVITHHNQCRKGDCVLCVPVNRCLNAVQNVGTFDETEPNESTDGQIPTPITTTTTTAPAQSVEAGGGGGGGVGGDLGHDATQDQQQRSNGSNAPVPPHASQSQGPTAAASPAPATRRSRRQAPVADTTLTMTASTSTASGLEMEFHVSMGPEGLGLKVDRHPEGLLVSGFRKMPPRDGVRVPNPSRAAGLLVGDVLVMINGQRFKEAVSAIEILRSAKDVLTMGVFRPYVLTTHFSPPCSASPPPPSSSSSSSSSWSGAATLSTS